MNWNTIDTAPDDEMLLLAAEFDGPGDWRIKIGYKDDNEYNGWHIFGASWTPTHWMKLPAPPSNAVLSGKPPHTEL